jgi:elongator complex protein 3
VRIQRIARDIPSKDIVAGPAKISNLRQLLADDMAKSKWRCRCIRCREVKGDYDPRETIRLFRHDYQASAGKEVFLSFENGGRTKLCSLLRLRLTPDKKALIREIHTYGRQLSVGKRRTTVSPQHKGFGKKLVKEAERIARTEFGVKKIAVISGVGVRDYFRDLGYKLEDTYMVKRLS